MAWNSRPGAYSSSSHGDCYGSTGYTYPTTSSTDYRQQGGYAYQQESYPAANAWASNTQTYGREYDNTRAGSSGGYYGRSGSGDEQGSSDTGSRPAYRRIAWTVEEDHVLLNIIEELCRVALWKAVKEEGGLVHRNANGIRTRTGVLLNKIRRKIDGEREERAEAEAAGGRQRAMDISNLTSG